MRRTCIRLAFVILCAFAGSAAAQSPIHEAPPAAPSTGRVVPRGEPGQALHVSGLVVDSGGKPIAGASLYVYQTDHEGYYGVKPASDNRNPRLKVFLRSDAQGAWSFDTIKPGAYPGGQVAGAHPLRSVGARPRAEGVRIVFAGEPLVTSMMQTNPAFSVRPIENGRVTERIVLR